MKILDFENLVPITEVAADTQPGQRFAFVSRDLHEKQIMNIREGKTKMVFFFEAVSVSFDDPPAVEFKLIGEEIEGV